MKNNKQSGNVMVSFMLFVTFAAIILGLMAGWVMNLVTLFHSNFTPITGALVLRVVGIFVAPIGGVMGYF